MADRSPKPTYSPQSPPFSPPSPPPERNTPPTPGGRGMGRGRARGITVAPGPVGDGQMRRTRWGEETPVGSGFLSCKAEAEAQARGFRGARNFRTYKEKNLFRGTPRGRIQRAPTVRVTRSSSRLDGGNVLMEGLGASKGVSPRDPRNKGRGRTEKKISTSAVAGSPSPEYSPKLVASSPSSHRMGPSLRGRDWRFARKERKEVVRRGRKANRRWK